MFDSFIQIDALGNNSKRHDALKHSVGQILVLFSVCIFFYVSFCFIEYGLFSFGFLFNNSIKTDPRDVEVRLQSHVE